ncbi:HEPN domain-containing protein [Candidatus Woesearchaeota archaeon]|nr:HEPN domain-containing protein [Candidatus Woesearchaeota archaeon]
MIRSFEFYMKEKKAVKQQPDNEMAASLMKKAEDRLKYIESQTLSDDNSGFIFEDVYESLREAAQAVLCADGYKPYSHEVLIAYLKENYSEMDSGMLDNFDELRKLRNLAVYGAEEVSEEKTKSALEFVKSVLPREINT